MKTRRKHKACLNCGELLEKKFNYCPNCGQENTDNEVSIGMLLREFTSNFFSLDSRFGRTLKPFLFAPGKVTVAFNEGKRVLYANPIRWYLVISLLHFFLLSKVFQPSDEDRRKRGFVISGETISEEKYDSMLIFRDSTSTEEWPISGEQYELINYLTEKSRLTPDEILDSLHFSERPFVDRLAIKQLTKINQESNASLNLYLLKQIPIIIFFLLPIFAFLLKVFYWKKGLYIHHLIHSIHIHSFLFLLLSIVWIITLIFKDFEDTGVTGTLIITTIYIILSCKRIYKTKLLKAFFKLLSMGLIYMFVITLALILGVLISLLFF